MLCIDAVNYKKENVTLSAINDEIDCVCCFYLAS